jgi:hypothetical protein
MPLGPWSGRASLAIDSFCAAHGLGVGDTNIPCFGESDNSDRAACHLALLPHWFLRDETPSGAFDKFGPLNNSLVPTFGILFSDTSSSTTLLDLLVRAILNSSFVFLVNPVVLQLVLFFRLVRLCFFLTIMPFTLPFRSRIF